MQRSGQLVITPGSWLCLLMSILAVGLLLHRLADALWQGYKFQGTEGPGYITLSHSTAVLGTACLALVAVTSAALWLAARARSARPAAVRSLFAACLAFGCIAAYWSLGISPLNEWCP